MAVKVPPTYFQFNCRVSSEIPASGPYNDLTAEERRIALETERKVRRNIYHDGITVASICFVSDITQKIAEAVARKLSVTETVVVSVVVPVVSIIE